MTKYPLYKKLRPSLTDIILGIQICSEKKSEVSIAGGLAASSGSGSEDRRPVAGVPGVPGPPVSVSPLVPGPGLLHQSLLHHQAAAAHSMQGNRKPFPRPFPMSTSDPRNPIFTISGLYPPFSSPLMSRAKPFESPASGGSVALFPGLGPGLPPHHLSPLLSSHLQAQAAQAAQAAHSGHFGLPHPFFPGPGPVTSAAAGGQKSPILARGVGGHTGK